MDLEEIARALGGGGSALAPIAPSAAAPAQTLEQPGWLRNFAASALRAGTSEMVGLPGEWAANLLGTTAEANDAWRSANTASSIASEILPLLAPYGAGAKLTAMGARAGMMGAPGARLFSEAALLARPVATTAGRAVVETLPVEAIRLMTTPLLGGDLERVATSAGFNLAGASLLGGGFGFLRGTFGGNGALQSAERVIADSLEDYVQTAPLQERLGAILRAAPNIADQDMQKLMGNVADELRFNIRNDTVRRGNLGPLEGVPEGQAGDIERLFRPRREGDLHVQKLIRSPREGFDSTEGWQDVTRQLGLPVAPEERAAGGALAQWEQNFRFPRVVTANSAAEAGRVQSNIAAHLTDVGNGWYLKREANQDLFVVARKLAGGVDGQPGDRWFLAQTNNPDLLLPGTPSLRRSDRLARFIGQVEEDTIKKGAAALPEDYVMRSFLATVDAMPLRLRTEKAKWDALEHLPQWMTKPVKDMAPIANRVGEKVKNVAAPAMAQFKNAPLASWVYWMGKNTFEAAEGKARTLFHGELMAGRNPASVVWKGITSGNGFSTKLAALGDEGVAAMQRINGFRLQGASLDDALTKALDDVPLAVRQQVEPVAREWDALSTRVFKEVQAHEKLFGRDVTPEDANYFLPHTWRGDYRVRLFDEKKRLREVASGRTQGEALAEAKRVAEQAGLRLDPRGVILADRDEDKLLLSDLFRGRKQATKEGFGVGTPYQTERRQGVGGYAVQEGKPLMTRELAEILENDVKDKYKYIAEMITKHQLAQKYVPEILQRHGQPTANALFKRLNDMAGRQTDFSRWQNKVMDSALGPTLGKNSASKTAAAFNALETHFNLFVGNIGYVAANAVSFLQTVAPKIALTRQLVRRGELDRAYGLYDFLPLVGPEGARGVAAKLSPVKLMSGALRDVFNPSAEGRSMFLRAAKEGVVAPKMYDEYVGQQSKIGQSVKRAMSGEEPVTNLMRAASGANSFIPVRMEELTRTHAFFTGLRIAEVLGAEGEARYQLAKQFTWRTMYGYAQADRPRLFTGPAGMMFGLFKNWSFHYISDWGMYGREALRGNYSALLWAMGGAAAIGGVGGVPLYTVIDSAQRAFTSKPLMENLYEAVGTDAGDALFYGMPGMFGVSLQGSASAPFNDPVRDITFMMNVATLDRMRKAGQLLGESWNNWRAGGTNPFETDRTWDLASYALMPRTLYKAMAQVEDGALKSIRNGRPILEGLTGFEQALNTVGLTPTRIARAWETSETLWRDQERTRALTAQYSEAYWRGMETDDPRAQAAALGGAIERGLDISAVMKGAMQRMTQNVQPQIPFDYLRRPEAIGRMEAMGLMPQ